MKNVALLLAALLPSFWAPLSLAADYKGCAPITYPKQKPEYALTATGHLDFKAKDTYRSDSNSDGDRVVTVWDVKQKQYRHQELRFENGRPVALKTYITGADKKYVGDVTTRHFAYDNGRCYVKDVVVDGDDSVGAVTYDRSFCPRLLKAANNMSDTPKDVRRVGAVIQSFDNDLRVNDHQVFGFDGSRLRSAEGADMIASIVGNCRTIGASYPDVKVSEKSAAHAGSDGADSSFSAE